MTIQEMLEKRESLHQELFYLKSRDIRSVWLIRDVEKELMELEENLQDREYENRIADHG